MVLNEIPRIKNAAELIKELSDKDKPTSWNFTPEIDSISGVGDDFAC